MVSPRRGPGQPQAQYNLGLWYAQGEGGTPDNVQAYMWFNLAAARFPPGDTRGRSLAASSRDAVATDMTSEQIAQAQKLARDWQPKYAPSTNRTRTRPHRPAFASFNLANARSTALRAAVTVLCPAAETFSINVGSSVDEAAGS